MRSTVLVLLSFLSSCIGTDFLDDPEVSEVLEISPDRIAVLVGENVQANATYFDQFGVARDVDVNWSTNPTSVAVVDGSGLLRGVAAGQALLFASFDSLIDTIRVTVVQDANSAAIVDITTPKSSLALGEMITLSSEIKNISGTIISGGAIAWSSSNGAVATVNIDGIVTGVGSGKTIIMAESDGIVSNTIELEVSGDRTGTFSGANGYKASGTATLKEVDGEIILELSADFTTDFALGTFIYLANNNTSGSTVRSAGIELGEITQNGARTFNVTANFPNVTLSQYQYVIVLCKPASIVFGFAQLN
ncbi:MAG: Ig-like domain-containing protein [Cyclobacteriaceae bacterium]